MDRTTAVLLITNTIFLVGFGRPLARHLSRVFPNFKGVRAWTVSLGGIYLAECVAFSASMATNILSFGLAMVWGLIFGKIFRALPLRQAVHLALRLSLYTCLPAISFLSILFLLPSAGWSLLDVEDGRRFGIPDFVPWPVCSVLGFFLAVSLSAVLFKTAVTTGIVAMLVHRSQRT